MKYHVICLVGSWDELLCIYETDAEPPRVGDFFSPRFISKEKFIDNYVVKKVTHQPFSPKKTKIILILEPAPNDEP